jgi:hypothetical protein
MKEEFASSISLITILSPSCLTFCLLCLVVRYLFVLRATVLCQVALTLLSALDFVSLRSVHWSVGSRATLGDPSDL